MLLVGIAMFGFVTSGVSGSFEAVCLGNGEPGHGHYCTYYGTEKGCANPVYSGGYWHWAYAYNECYCCSGDMWYVFAY